MQFQNVLYPIVVEKDDCLVSEVYREEGHSRLNDIKLNSQRFGNISKEICQSFPRGFIIRAPWVTKYRFIFMT